MRGVALLALALALAACGGRVDEGRGYTASFRPPIPGGSSASADCALEEEEVQGFAVDRDALWRVMKDCRQSRAGLLVVREDRATGERRLVADYAQGSPPVMLAGDALILGDKDAIHPIRTDTGESDDLAMRPMRLASDGPFTYVAVDGGTSATRYAILRVGSQGEAETVGTIAGAFQMHELAGFGGQAFVSLWTVCTGAESSCAALYRVDGSGLSQVAAWPVTDLGARLGPLAIDDTRAVTTVNGDLVEAKAGGEAKVVASLGASMIVASLALGSRDRTYACLVPAGEVTTGRVVEVDGEHVRELASSPCARVLWSEGELFWEEPTARDRYGDTVIARKIGRAKTD
jgi:hypothetical protein